MRIKKQKRNCRIERKGKNPIIQVDLIDTSTEMNLSIMKKKSENDEKNKRECRRK